jgi:C4-type Zn-finger protein
MTEIKRRQGQNGETPKTVCPKCEKEYLKRNYTRELVYSKQRFVKFGWICPNSSCDYIVKDLVELEDLEEGDDESTNKAEKIKKLTAELIKNTKSLTGWQAFKLFIYPTFLRYSQ